MSQPAERFAWPQHASNESPPTWEAATIAMTAPLAARRSTNRRRTSGHLLTSTTTMPKPGGGAS